MGTKLVLCPFSAIFSLLIGAIYVGPITAMIVLMNTLSALLILPKTMVVSIYTLLCTPRLGPIAKIIFSLLVLIPLVAWVPIVLLISLLGGFFWGLFAPVVFGTFELLEGSCNKTLTKPLELAYHSCIDFINWSWKSYFEIMADFRQANGERFELPLSFLCGAIVLLAFGLALVPSVTVLIVTVKLIPAIVSSLIQVVQLYHARAKRELCCICYIPFILALFLTPVAVVGAAFLLLILSSIAPFYITINYHDKGFLKILKGLFYVLYFFDKETNSIIFHTERSFFSCFGEWDIQLAVHNRDQRLANENFNENPQMEVRRVSGVPRLGSYMDFGSISLSAVWANFFTQAKALAIASVELGLVPPSDYEDEEPYLIMGVPALVTYRTIHRSNEVYPSEPGTFIMADGQIVNNASRPKVIFSGQVYNKMKEVRLALQTASPASALEYSFLQYHILVGGRPSASSDEETAVWNGLSSIRKNELVRVTVSLAQLTAMLTRAPTFLRRFREVFQAAARASSNVSNQVAPAQLADRWSSFVQLHTERAAETELPEMKIAANLANVLTESD
jgi:hypothetical protein